MKDAANPGWIFWKPWRDARRRRNRGLAMMFDSARALAENRDDFEGTLKIGYSLLSDLLHMLSESGGGCGGEC